MIDLRELPKEEADKLRKKLEKERFQDEVLFLKIGTIVASAAAIIISLLKG